MPKKSSDHAPRDDSGMFLDALWQDQTGIACITLADAQKRFRDHFFQWPAQRDELLDFAKREAVDNDVYFTPLLRTSDQERVAAKSAPGRWAWADLDGAEPPAAWVEQFRPSIVESGTPGRLHVYVPLAEMSPPDQIAEINRRLVRELGGDAAPVHPAALMRVPGTLNHKKGQRRPVYLQVPPNGFRGHSAEDLARMLGGKVDPPRKAADPIPDEIYEGERETVLVSLAGSMRRRNADVAAILAALEVTNERCVPPASQADLERIANSVGRYAPGEVPMTPQELDDEFERRVAEIEFDLRAREEAKRRRAAETRSPMPLGESLADLLAEDDEDLEYRVQGLFLLDGIFLLNARKKAGKTTLRNNLVRSLVDGDPFLGRFEVEPTEGRVGVLDFEMSRRLTRKWFRRQGITNQDRIWVESLRGHESAFDIRDPHRRTEWAKRLRDQGVTFLIVDCLAPALAALGLNENHNDEVGAWFVGLRQLMAEAGVSECLVIHHMGHNGERGRGASNLGGTVDGEWFLNQEIDQAGNVIDPSSPRFFRAFGRDVELAEVNLEFDPANDHLTVPEVTQSRREIAAERAARKKESRASSAMAERCVRLVGLVHGEPGKSWSYYRRAVGGNTHTFQEVVDEALDEIEIREIGTSKYLHPRS